MEVKDVPFGDRILPSERCEKCNKKLEIVQEAGDEEDIVYIGCPDYLEDGHTEHNGVPRKRLIQWGWKL